MFLIIFGAPAEHHHGPTSAEVLQRDNQSRGNISGTGPLWTCSIRWLQARCSPCELSPLEYAHASGTRCNAADQDQEDPQYVSHLPGWPPQPQTVSSRTVRQ